MRDRLAGQNENGENCTFLAKPVISVDVSVKSVFQLLAILQVKKWGGNGQHKLKNGATNGQNK